VGSPAERLIPYSQFELLRLGREVVRQEAEALLSVARSLDASFCAAAEMIRDCAGSVIVCGMGKAGLIGQKLVATFSSTGTRAHFLHPAEAVHGDMGCVHEHDLLLALSNSGETQELCTLVPMVRRMGVTIIALTATDQSTLATQADVVLPFGRVREACPMGLAPTTSTTVMLAIGDALALVVSQQRGFTSEHFARFHPAGNLGRRLKSVADVMRPRDQLRISTVNATVREVFAAAARPGRRTGAVLLVDDQGFLRGLFTDSDLARLLESRQDHALDQPIAAVMTASPMTVQRNATFAQVIDLLAERKISELPVIDEQGRPVGLIDITDVIGWFPPDRRD
jgi:arabinose-5-phosphate isomerase